MSSRTWPKTIACIICGNPFTMQKRSGPPPLTCSDKCRKRRRNDKIAEWRETHECPDHQHGLTGYTNYQCACDVCRKAEREYMREYRDKKRETQNDR